MLIPCTLYIVVVKEYKQYENNNHNISQYISSNQVCRKCLHAWSQYEYKMCIVKKVLFFFLNKGQGLLITESDPLLHIWHAYFTFDTLTNNIIHICMLG